MCLCTRKPCGLFLSPFENIHAVCFVASKKLILNVSKIRLRLIFSRSSHPTCLFSKGLVFPLPAIPAVSGKTPVKSFCCFCFLLFWRTADTCVPLLQYKGTQVSAPRFPLQSFCRCCFVPAVFFRLIASKTAPALHERQKGFLLQSLSEGLPSLVLFTSSHTAVTCYVGSEGKVL